MTKASDFTDSEESGDSSEESGDSIPIKVKRAVSSFVILF